MKELDKIYTLAEVLASTQEFPWDSSLFLDKHSAWHGKSNAAVMRTDGDETGPEQDEEAADNPEFASQQGLTYALNMASVQDIVSNAKQQNPNVDETTLVKAFLHYHDHDAFINLGK